MSIETRPPGGNRAAVLRNNFERTNPTGNLNPVNDEFEREQRLLAAGWFDPVELNDAAYLAGLTGADFRFPTHAGIFAYLCGKAMYAGKPDVEQCLRLALQAGLHITPDDLFDLILNTRTVAAELHFYATDVVAAAVSRKAEELRAVCRDAVRAVARGLAYEALLHEKELRHGRTKGAGTPIRTGPGATGHGSHSVGRTYQRPRRYSRGPSARQR